MQDPLIIFDTTMRDGEQSPGASMTRDEKRNPSEALDQGRRHRIAMGAGVELHEVNQLVKQFDAMSRATSAMVGKGNTAMKVRNFSEEKS